MEIISCPCSLVVWEDRGTWKHSGTKWTRRKWQKKQGPLWFDSSLSLQLHLSASWATGTLNSFQVHSSPGCAIAWHVLPALLSPQQHLSSLIPEIGSLFTLCISAEVILCVLSTKNKPSYVWLFSFSVSLPPRVHSLGTLTHILTLVFRLIPSTWNFLTEAHQLIEYTWDSFVSSNTASFLQNQITEKTQIECSWDGLGW